MTAVEWWRLRSPKAARNVYIYGPHGRYETTPAKVEVIKAKRSFKVETGVESVKTVPMKDWCSGFLSLAGRE